MKQNRDDSDQNLSFLEEKVKIPAKRTGILETYALIKRNIGVTALRDSRRQR